jgi:hypothetical protein
VRLVLAEGVAEDRSETSQRQTARVELRRRAYRFRIELPKPELHLARSQNDKINIRMREYDKALTMRGNNLSGHMSREESMGEDEHQKCEHDIPQKLGLFASHCNSESGHSC